MRGPTICPGLDEFAGAEDRVGVVRRIVDRGHAERQRGEVDPALLRDPAVLVLRSVRVHVDQARHDRLARASTTFAPAGTLVVADAPTASMRLPSTMTVPLSITSSPRIVMMRALVSAITPAGLSKASAEADVPPLLRHRAAFSRRPARNGNASFNSRSNSSGPSDQYTLSLAADQCRFSPASRVSRYSGNAGGFRPDLLRLPSGLETPSRTRSTVR